LAFKRPYTKDLKNYKIIGYPLNHKDKCEYTVLVLLFELGAHILCVEHAPSD